ncbi:hypothetical protein EV702DRAFT_1204789 [Suillus placidus]|uniref:Uncharacterized protein n=1 Tax=Suillus placidus TaxID=48579 RepID=A0A9P6ZGC0_9AGAM|nr:hypothetical protein EV702DRAFT_1204789 [Suillus placidus]
MPSLITPPIWKTHIASPFDTLSVAVPIVITQLELLENHYEERETAYEEAKAAGEEAANSLHDIIGVLGEI